MSKSISSINREKSNIKNGRCQLLDNTGTIIAEFEGVIVELYCQFFVIKDKKLYDIVRVKSDEYELQEHVGTIDTN